MTLYKPNSIPDTQLVSDVLESGNLAIVVYYNILLINEFNFE